MADEKVIIELDLRLANGTTQRAQAQVTQGFATAGTNASKSFSSKFKEGLAIGGGIALVSAGLNVLRKSFQAVTRQIGEAVDEMRAFGRGVAEVNSILPTNAKLTRESTNQLIEFSSQFGSKPREQARAFYDIVSAGVKGTAKQLTTLEVANKTAVAGLVDITSAAKVLVSSVNSYASSGLTATRASDVLFATVREGITTFGELSQFIGNVAPVAAAAGVSFEELNGALAAITKNGISTDVAVTGLRNVLTAIISPTKEASDEADRLKIKFDAATLATDGLAKFLGTLEKATGGNTESLAKLFGNVRGLVPILSIVKGNFEGFKKTLDSVKDSAGATDKAFAILSETSDFQLSKLGQNITNFLLKPLRALDPIITATAKALNSLFGFDERSITGVKKAIAAKKEEIAATQKLVDMGESIAKNNKKSTNSYSAISQALATSNGKLDKNTEKLKLQKAELDRLLEVKNRLTTKDVSDAPIVDTSEMDLLNAVVLAARDSISATDAAWDSFTSGFSTGTQGMKANIASISEDMKKFSKVTRDTMKKGLSSAVSQGFAAFGAALVNGENALKAFGKAMIASIGATLVQLGTSFILRGIAYSFDPLMGGPAVGGPLIGAGAAMAATGGAMQALGGGSAGGGVSAGAAGGSSSFTGDTGTDQLETVATAETAEPATNVVINVDRIVDNATEGAFIVDLINEATDANNVTIRRNAIA